MILVHGNWSEWSDWDECIDSRTSRNRSCSNPELPTYCEGAEKENTLCFMPTKGTYYQIKYSISNKIARHTALENTRVLISILKGQIGCVMQIKLVKLKKV